MSQWRDVTWPGSSVRRRMRLDPETGHVITHSQQDVEPVLRENTAYRNADRGSTRLWAPGGETANMVRVAEIPKVVLEKWRKQHGIDVFDKNDWPKIVALLNSSEYAYLRTAPGRI